MAILGLGVNLVSAWLLHGGSGHDHDHDHDHDDHTPLHKQQGNPHGNAHPHDHHHDHHGHHHDLNLHAAYIHVLTDAATSVLAIVALFAGKWWGAGWMDPAMGIIGSVLVASWAISLLRKSGRVLLDAHMTDPVAEEIREAVEQSPVPASLADMHLWRVGKGKYAVLLSVLSTDPAAAEAVRKALAVHEELVHVNVEWLEQAAAK